MGEHSKTSASSMYRWETCPGSVALCVPLPEVKSPYAEEGTRVHDLCAKVLNGVDPFKVGATNQEELDAILLYYTEIRKDSRSYLKKGTKTKLFVEKKFDLSSVYPGCFGTADAVIWDPTNNLLRVYDFKYGKGVHVEAENNSQLLYYALGAALEFNYPVFEFECVIVQPRCKSKSGLVRRWRGTWVDLLDFEVRLRTAAKRTEDPKAPLVSGRHCYFCPAKNMCPELKRQSDEKAKAVFEEIT